MRSVSQYISYLLINPINTVLFLYLLLSGCSYLDLVKKSVPSHQVEIERSYFSNGNIEYEAEFINGKLDGISRVWVEDGTLFSESEYSNGKPHGIWNRYHPNGSLMYEVYYEYGKKHGVEKWYYDNGQEKSEHKFNHGKPESEIIRWGSDGTLIY